MTWIQKLAETYDRCAGALQPVSHTTQQAHLEIVLDGQGRFRRASVVPKEDCTTLVPCTEESGGRSGNKPVNHPLCDKLQYVAGDYPEFGGEVTAGFSGDPQEPHRGYVADLVAWADSANSHPMLTAILAYVRAGHVIRDLVEAGVLPLDNGGKLRLSWGGSQKAATGIFKAIKSLQGAFVRWRVETPECLASGTWEDRHLQEAWISHSASLRTKRGLCMVSGRETTLTEQHPSKLRNPGDKAKLISSNDLTGYTFKGRFLNSDQACGVGVEVSQKAHIALRWLIEKQGHRNGSQAVVAWADSGVRVPDPFKNSFELFAEGAQERLPPQQSEEATGQAFGRRLSKLMAGYRVALGPTVGIVVMGLDSASKDNTGRLAITYYRELTGSEFLERVQSWHSAHAWHQVYGRELRFVGAPSPRDIAEAAFGRRVEKDDRKAVGSRRVDERLCRATVERLLPCIVDARPVPRDLVETVVRRACGRAGVNRWEWERDLGIACALLRGNFKEREYQMKLEYERLSRDYLYGRLLAIAEHIESRSLYLADEKRETTAARMMQRFAERPSSTWRNIELALGPYKARLRAKRPHFLHSMERRLDEVISAFKADDFVDDRELSGEFLLGYHCERQALMSDKTAVPEVDEDPIDN